MSLCYNICLEKVIQLFLGQPYMFGNVIIWYVQYFAIIKDIYSVQIQVETINHWLVKSLDIGWTSVTSPELPLHFVIKLKSDYNHVWPLHK